MTQRYMLTLVLSLTMATLPALGLADEIKIGAGSAIGEYTNTVVPALDAALQEAGDNSATAVESAGSRANLELLAAGDVDAALVQLDVLALTADSNAQLIGLIAPEALFCAARVDGRVRSYYNLTDPHADPLVLSVGPEGSGSAATMEYLLAIDPEFDIDQVALIYEGNVEAELDRLAGGSRDLVCFVMLANPENPLIQKVADSDELQFINFVSAVALEATVGDINVYEATVVPVSKGLWGFRAKKVETLSTWSALVVGADTDPGVMAALQGAAEKPDLLPPTTAAGKAKSLYGDFKSKAKDWTGKAKDKALELKEKAREKALVLREQAGELSSKAAEKAGQLKDKAVEKAGELKDKAMELKEKATTE